MKCLICSNLLAVRYKHNGWRFAGILAAVGIAEPPWAAYGPLGGVVQDDVVANITGWLQATLLCSRQSVKSGGGGAISDSIDWMATTKFVLFFGS